MKLPRAKLEQLISQCLGKLSKRKHGYSRPDRQQRAGGGLHVNSPQVPEVLHQLPGCQRGDA